MFSPTRLLATGVGALLLVGHASHSLHAAAFSELGSTTPPYFGDNCGATEARANIKISKTSREPPTGPSHK